MGSRNANRMRLQFAQAGRTGEFMRYSTDYSGPGEGFINVKHDRKEIGKNGNLTDFHR